MASLMEVLEHNGRGYCGLFCDSCSLYIGTTEEPQELERLAAKYHKDVGEVRCLGCRSATQSFSCSKCDIKDCSRQKEIDNCSLCSEYPCKMLSDFKALLPHRNELYESLDLLKKNDLEIWQEKMVSDYSCPSCMTLNSPYTVKCRACGKEPSSLFFKRNEESIRKKINTTVE